MGCDGATSALQSSWKTISAALTFVDDDDDDDDDDLQRMENDRITKQALNWQPIDGHRKRGRPRKNWRSTLTEDLCDIGQVWESAEDVTKDRLVWRSYMQEARGRTMV